MSAEELKLGIYRHYKGPLYQVLGRARDANETVPRQDTDGVVRALPRVVVVYMPLQLDGAHLGPRMSVRTEDDFHALVHQDGTPCDGTHCVGDGPTQYHTVHGPHVRRFTYLESELTQEMLGG